MKDLFDLAPVEVWADAPNWEGYYEVSNFGRVRSLKRVVYSKHGELRKLKSKFLKVAKNKNGYVYVHFYRASNGYTFTVHRLVAEIFIPNPLGLPCVNHKNGVKTDNRVENLEWCTQKENNIHARANGLCDKVKDKRKIPINVIIAIRAESTDLGYVNIAKKYKLTRSTIRDIILKLTYKDI